MTEQFNMTYTVNLKLENDKLRKALEEIEIIRKSQLNTMYPEYDYMEDIGDIIKQALLLSKKNIKQ